MDSRNHPKSSNFSDGQTDADAAPIDPVREDSSIIYFCSAEEVSEGFAIALRAMGFDEILLSDLVAQSHATSNPEDN
jgi:hypothetical protein